VASELGAGKAVWSLRWGRDLCPITGYSLITTAHTNRAESTLFSVATQKLEEPKNARQLLRPPIIVSALTLLSNDILITNQGSTTNKFPRIYIHVAAI
jgi:hypothetical protein